MGQEGERGRVSVWLGRGREQYAGGVGQGPPSREPPRVLAAPAPATPLPPTCSCLAAVSLMPSSCARRAAPMPYSTPYARRLAWLRCSAVIWRGGVGRWHGEAPGLQKVAGERGAWHVEAMPCPPAGRRPHLGEGLVQPRGRQLLEGVDARRKRRHQRGVLCAGREAGRARRVSGALNAKHLAPAPAAAPTHYIARSPPEKCAMSRNSTWA
jgi:hypothetical protein